MHVKLLYLEFVTWLVMNIHLWLKLHFAQSHGSNIQSLTVYMGLSAQLIDRLNQIDQIQMTVQISWLLFISTCNKAKLVPRLCRV